MPTYSDLDLTFRSHPGTKDILKKTDVDAVKASMKNVLLMGPFDSPFDPVGGAALRTLFFELLTPSTVASAKKRIINALTELEPRAVIEDLYVGDDGSNGVNVGVLFHVVGSARQQTLSFVIERAR